MNSSVKNENFDSAIDYYLKQVEDRVEKKKLELEESLKKSEKVRQHAETIEHFVGKWDKFEIRVKDFQREIAEMDKNIDEKTAEIESNRNFSQREVVELTKLFEKLEKLTEERKDKERTLLKLRDAEILEEDED